MTSIPNSCRAYLILSLERVGRVVSKADWPMNVYQAQLIYVNSSKVNLFKILTIATIQRASYLLRCTDVALHS